MVCTFGEAVLKEFAAPTSGFSPFDAAKMYDLSWMTGGMTATRVAAAMAAKPCPWLSVTKIALHNDPLPQVVKIPFPMLPDLYKKLLPPPEFRVAALHDYSTSKTWYDAELLTEKDREYMSGSWQVLKELGEQAADQMAIWNCKKPPLVGWELIILRDR